jgi:hypothetical protein
LHSWQSPKRYEPFSGLDGLPPKRYETYSDKNYINNFTNSEDLAPCKNRGAGSNHRHRFPRQHCRYQLAEFAREFGNSQRRRGQHPVRGGIRHVYLLPYAAV